MTKNSFIYLFSLITVLSISSCAPNTGDNTNNKETTLNIINDKTKGEIINRTPLSSRPGDIVILEVKTNANYYLDDLIINDHDSFEFYSNNKYKFTLKEGKNDITPIYKDIVDSDATFKIKFNDGGTVQLVGDNISSNSTINANILPKEGYYIDSIKLNNKDVLVNGTTYTFKPIKNINFLNVTFKEGVGPDINPNPDPKPEPEPDPTPEPDPDPTPEPNPGPDPDPTKEYEIVDKMKIIETKISDYHISPHDPYVGVNRDDFNSDPSFEYAKTYEDAYYRTKHYLMSGDTTEQGHLVSHNCLKVETKKDGKYYLMNALCRYEIDLNGNFISYTVNTLDNTDYKIFYNAGYQSLDDVSAYLFAFGDRPKNYFDASSTTEGKIEETWGRYLRLNNRKFNGPSSSHPNEPPVTGIIDTYNYRETDFGSRGGYSVGNREEPYYNNGHKIGRGACRFVYNNGFKYKNDILTPNDRHVFYTYNHYNDFQEYLNYKGGFTPRFGGETAGNPPDSKNPKYEPTLPFETKKAIFNI